MNTNAKKLTDQVKKTVKESAAAYRGAITENVKSVGGTESDLAKHNFLMGGGASHSGLIGSDLGFRNRLVGAIYKALPPLLSGNQFGRFKISDTRWDTSALHGSVDWKEQGKGRSAIKKMAPNSIAITKLTANTRVPHEDGSFLIETGLDGFLWGPNIRPECEKTVSKQQSKFQRRPATGQAIELQWLDAEDDQLVSLIADMFSISPNSTNAMTPAESLRLPHILASCPLEKLIFSNGWGKVMMDGIIADEKRRIALAQKDQVVPLRPDEIQRYLAGFMKRCPDYPYDILPIMWMR